MKITVHRMTCIACFCLCFYKDVCNRILLVHAYTVGDGIQLISAVAPSRGKVNLFNVYLFVLLEYFFLFCAYITFSVKEKIIMRKFRIRK